jgi:tetratricopeptide (TPR) repeat protein
MERACTADPSEQEINERASALLEVKRIDEALALFKRNTELHPDSSDAFDGLGEALLEKGDRAAAIPAYERALALSRDDRARAQLRKTLERLRTHSH